MRRVRYSIANSGRREQLRNSGGRRDQQSLSGSGSFIADEAESARKNDLWLLISAISVSSTKSATRQFKPRPLLSVPSEVLQGSLVALLEM